MVLKECMTCEAGMLELFREVQHSVDACMTTGFSVRDQRGPGEDDRKSTGSDQSEN